MCTCHSHLQNIKMFKGSDYFYNALYVNAIFFQTLLISHWALIGKQFASIWFDKDKLLFRLWNAPLKPVTENNHRKPAAMLMMLS